MSILNDDTEDRSQRGARGRSGKRRVKTPAGRMARPATVTTEQILAAIEKLRREGRPLTGYGVRQIIGSGNAARFQKIIDDLGGSASAPTDDLPPDVEQRFDKALAGAAGLFRQMVCELHASAVAACERRGAAAETAIAEAMSRAREADLLVAGLEGQLDERAEKLAASEAVCHRAEAQVTALRADKEQLKEEREGLRRELERLRHDLGHALGRLEAMERSRSTEVVH